MIGRDAGKDGGVINDDGGGERGLEIDAWGGYGDTSVVFQDTDGDVLVCFPDFCCPSCALASSMDGIVMRGGI